ncbi:MAG: 3-oxoacyl-ACP reductase FabG [Bacteroidales bacterium]|nr:3-oxoacyl-ACP reductase FabG [Bacteroidales bacterium]
MRLTGKVAVVTGGSRDIGRAIALKLAKEGAKVCINYCHDESKAAETLEMISEAGGIAIAVKADVTKEQEVQALFKAVADAWGRIDVLVNNAGGIMGRKAIQDQDENWYNSLMDLNFKSCWLCTREVLKYMGRGGSIVNISSQAARDGGGPGSSIYACGKAAMLCHTRAMAKELGPQGIRVNAICPGMINTYFHDTFTKPEGREALHRSAPLRREGEAPEVADLACYLASDESSYITGNGIDINGGCLFS